MMKLKLNIRKKAIKNSIKIILLLNLLILQFGLIFNLNSNNSGLIPKNIIDKVQTPKGSAVWARINLTNYQINNTRHLHNEKIIIEGNLKYINGTGVKFQEVAIFVDDIFYPQFDNTTNNNGDFQIGFIIPYDFDVYSVLGYKIQVNVTDTNKGMVIKDNFFIIFANATSFLNVNDADVPYIPGEVFLLNGYLRCDNVNGTGISNAQINYYWYNSSHNWASSSFFTSPTDGSISQSISIPINAFSEKLYLNLSYSGDSPYTGSTQKTLSINLFWDINCEWNTIPDASEGDTIIIKGQLSSNINNTIKIYNRTIDIYYDGNYINSTNTDTNGNFSHAYTIPTGTGNKSIQIKLITSVGLSLSSVNYINITNIIIPPSDPTDTEPPYLGFLLIFLPIMIGIVVGLSAYGYYRYKKQDKESRIVNLPLESKIINLKILKDTGRLEESLSYLFNAIYLDLINAKFGRTRSDNETIRDFAIISVKNLKLSPTTLYPFIQKVEEIIYAKPFQITDKEFYNAINLFSPIYFELTGYNFVLNF